MTTFELVHLCAQPFRSALNTTVRRRLQLIAKSHINRPKILDAGGRQSRYTIGVPADVTISDLPKETAIQKKLNLGLTPTIIGKTLDNRSNIETIILDDMTHSAFADESFHIIVSVEVLEHVHEDYLFVMEAQRLLKPGGFFLMTTPNGDFVPNTNPDHKRHYTKQQLLSLIQSRFSQVQVEYAMSGGMFRMLGMKPWSLRRPVQTLLCMAGNVITLALSGGNKIKDQKQGTYHLIATARK